MVFLIPVTSISVYAPSSYSKTGYYGSGALTSTSTYTSTSGSTSTSYYYYTLDKSLAIILPNGPVPVTPDKSKFYSLASLLAFGLTNYLSTDSDSNPKSKSVFN